MTHAEDMEAALAGLVHENNELRAIVRRVREYAQLQHDLAQDYRDHGGLYMGRTHDEIGTALERIIGDLP